MNNEIKALRSELALLKLQFSERVNQVEERLNILLAQENLSSTHIQNDDSNASLSSAQPANIQPEQTPAVVTNQKPIATNKKIKTPAKPSAFSLFFQSIIQSLLSLLFEWFTPVTNLYKSYKEKGMLGIFILTIAGIALVLAGFGYLMQLLIDQLGAGSKSLLMCFAALLVMVIGIQLKIKTRFSEFATAIVTLGILLSYCTVYFSGSVYGILPNIVVLLLYFIIALACHGIAHWLDTKVVSTLGIIGIATMPILSNTAQIEPLYYLLSLAFVATSSLIFAYKYQEKWLATVSLAFTLVAIEWVIGFEKVQLSAWAVNVFYCIFLLYSALTLFTHQKPYKVSLVFIAALTGSITLMFFQASDLFSTQMNACFIFNGVFCAAIAIMFYKVKHETTPFIILLTALWAALAIISIVSNAYWGISWAIEGLMLLYIGKRYLLPFVSNQGQGLLTIALLYSWAALAPYFPLPALKSIDGWILSIAVIGIIAVWQRMISDKGFNQFSQNTIQPLLQLIEVVWVTLLLVTSSYIWIGEWTGVLALLLQVAILFRSRYCKNVAIEIFAALLICIPAYYVTLGIITIKGFSFTALPLFAKLAVISIFAQLWLWSAFYRKFSPDSQLTKITEAARILFYLLIPICWVGSAIRHLNENALFISWLSPALALFLAHQIKHRLLITETKILTGITSILFIAIVGFLSPVYSIITLIGFSLLYGISYILSKKSHDKIYQFIASWGLISIGLALPSIVGAYSNSLLAALITGIVYWTGCLTFIKRVELIKTNRIAVFIANSLLVITAWLLTPENPMYAVIPVIFLISVIYQKEYFLQQSFIVKKTKHNGHLFLHSIGIITYLALLLSLPQYRADLFIAPILAIHGAIILFLRNRQLTTIRYSFSLIILGIGKLALVDAVNALLWQKVVLFMGIGIFILVASFWYQKLVKSMDKNEPPPQEKNTVGVNN